MSQKSLCYLTFLLVFIGVQPAMANQPPGPLVLLPEVLILPIMKILTLVGGGYAVLHRRRKKSRSQNIILTLGAILAILLSGMHEGYGVMVALIFGIIAATRGVRMIFWGLRARWHGTPPEYLTQAHPGRLMPAGGLLVLITLFLMGLAVAFVSYWPMGNARREKALQGFVAYQLAYAHLEKSRTGERRFDRLTEARFQDFVEGLGKNPQDISPTAWGYHDFVQSPYVRVKYTADAKGFTVSVLPYKGFPFFPYNYLISQASYHADETGQIRMIQVHAQDVICPPDAPVVMQVGEADIQEVLNKIRSSEK